ncbi:protein ALWAYS EARLY 2 isoform X1 [Vitis vinifera]|uniref:protein ALWAYS EARLY 2 isoform X1 n=2 Tax=Vitis vinifera TaxID=29760 RepID=UPI0008FEC0FB|nr:protein ALWAYS EARLY 2 isoform X1 [Vitis vinifera]XP_019080575.1 protein ALWAYS EARLY 2 isoform X1 [Vitis vinifera]|eukprot:XP_019080574.1 PREDICTED: protein ALWAYS EARLY 2 isoform X1 [Vitis vinifera]
MAPTKKYRGVNKRFLNSHEVSLDRDIENSTKSRQRKRKLSDMLGSQWSKEELEHFYEAYRKYGKDWKKVAGVVRNRSLEMVEALYNMNRAYLSLPEGTASVVGLIAMMTDHYNVLGGGDNESNDVSGTPRKTQKPVRGKVHLSISKEELLQPPSVANDGCLSLLKRSLSDGIRPHAVRKRTPRFPVSCSYKKGNEESYFSLNKVSLRSDMDTTDDEVAHVAALTLTEASLREGSHASQAPFRRTEHMKASPVQSRERMPLQMVQTKIHGIVTDEDYFEGNLESRGAENGDYAGDTCSLMDSECVGTVVLQEGKKFCDNEKVEEIGNNQFDDCREACSDTEGHNMNPVKRKIDTEVTNAKIEPSSPCGQRKRSKKLFFGDESSALDALQTLADLSLMMPDSAVESESSIQLKEEKITLDNVHEAMFASHQRDKNKLMVAKERVVKAIPGVEVTASIKYEHGRDSAIDVNALSEAQQRPESNNKQLKRKDKSLASKALAEEENKSMVKGRHAGQIAALSKQWKSVRPLEHSLNSDQKEARNDLAGSTASHVNLPTKQRSRRKMHLKKTLIQKEMKSPENSFSKQSSKYSTSLQYSTDYLKKKISCSLSSYMARRWCTFEWFYSAIDYPWFVKKEFVEYLDHVGLGHIQRLSRVEWDVIRSSLGKPRRFSERFLHEEKEKLKQYRKSVRTHYTELRTGAREGLPRDLARPLSVGQRVIALHPKTREVHNGSVLTVDHDKCMVQFDRAEIGVEFVMDIDCMPSDPLDNMPEALRRQNSTVGQFLVNSKEQKVRHLVNAHTPMNSLIKQAKEALLMELRHANNDVLGNEDGFLKDSESLKKHCAMVLVHLKEVSSALLYLRQCEAYPGKTLPPWLTTSTISSGPLMPPSSLDNPSSTSLEPGFNVGEIVLGSRSKAHKMVHAAMKAIASMKQGEEAFTRIGDALDSMHKQQLRSDSGVSVLRVLDPVNGSFAHPNQLTSFTSEPLLTSHASGPKLPNDSGKIEAPIASELITSCVAALLMIQTCTERQYPPSDVAQILDSAIISLHPGCPQNLPIYREIEMCMGRIKTQILALVPTLH